MCAFLLGDDDLDVQESMEHNHCYMSAYLTRLSTSTTDRNVYEMREILIWVSLNEEQANYGSVSGHCGSSSIF